MDEVAQELVEYLRGPGGAAAPKGKSRAIPAVARAGSNDQTQRSFGAAGLVDLDQEIEAWQGGRKQRSAFRAPLLVGILAAVVLVGGGGFAVFRFGPSLLADRVNGDTPTNPKASGEGDKGPVVVTPSRLKEAEDALARHDVEAALTPLNEEIKASPRNARALHLRGQVWFLKADLEQARRPERGRAGRPPNAALLADRGATYLERGQWDQAKDDFDRALRLDKQAAKARSNRAAPAGPARRPQQGPGRRGRGGGRRAEIGVGKDQPQSRSRPPQGLRQGPRRRGRSGQAGPGRDAQRFATGPSFTPSGGTPPRPWRTTTRPSSSSRRTPTPWSAAGTTIAGTRRRRKRWTTTPRRSGWPPSTSPRT